MWRKTYNKEWEIRKGFMLRRALEDVPSRLSTVYESDDSNSDSSSDFLPKPVDRTALVRERSPLPELTIERVPKVDRHDEPEEFYQKLEITVQKYIEKLKRGGSSNYSDSEFSSAVQSENVTLHPENIEDEGYINTGASSKLNKKSEDNIEETEMEDTMQKNAIFAGPIFKKKNQEPFEYTKETIPREELYFEDETGTNELDSNHRHNSIEDITDASCEMTDSRDGDVEQMRAAAVTVSETHVPQNFSNSSEASVPDEHFVTRRRHFSLINAATNRSWQSINLNDSNVNEVRSPFSSLEENRSPSPSPPKQRRICRDVGVQTNTPTYLSLFEGLSDNFMLIKIGNTIKSYPLGECTNHICL